MTNTREIVLDILMDVLEHDKMSHYCIRKALSTHSDMDKAMRAFVTKVTQGTIEHKMLLDDIVNRYSKTKVHKMKPMIRTILRMSTYQLLFMDGIPDSACCNEAVKLAVKHKFSGLKGFVNGVLRSIARDKENIQLPKDDTLDGISIRYSVPMWILEKWKSRYSLDEIRGMCQHFQTEPRLTARIHQSITDYDSVINSLEKQKVVWSAHPFLEQTVILEQLDRLDDVEAFQKGWLQVQDTSSILCGMTISPKKDDKVLDVCSAPGGKALHAADILKGTGMVTACDLTEFKVKMIQENIDRTGLSNIQAIVRDATAFVSEEEEKYDVVIADLPCSGLGIMGRKKDIKYRMTRENQQELVELQRQILSVVYRYVKPGGSLIYSTCTVNEQENEDNVAWMQEQLGLVPQSLAEFLPTQVKETYPQHTKGYVQLIPGVLHMDGFFIARMKKNIYM